MTTYFFGWLILFDQLMFDNWFFGRLIFLKIDFSPVNASFIVLLSFKGHILSFCPLQDCFLDHLSFSSLLDLLWKTNTPTFKEIFHQLTVYSASSDILKNLHLFPPPNFFSQTLWADLEIVVEPGNLVPRKFLNWKKILSKIHSCFSWGLFLNFLLN